MSCPEDEAYLGIRALNEREHHDMGAPFPPLSERFERLEETVQIAPQMWSGVSRSTGSITTCRNQWAGHCRSANHTHRS